MIDGTSQKIGRVAVDRREQLTSADQGKITRQNLTTTPSQQLIQQTSDHRQVMLSAPGIFIEGGYNPGSLGTEVRQWSLGVKTVWGMLKQFADIVYRF